MADERLRELERRWRETGAPADEAAFLLERVRAGTLTREKLELAAWCDHAAAILATGTSPPGRLPVWIKGLWRWDEGTLAVRASRAAALAAVEATGAGADAAPALGSIDAWLELRTPESARQAVLEADSIDRIDPGQLGHIGLWPLALAAKVVASAARATGVTGIPDSIDASSQFLAGCAIELARDALCRPGVSAVRAGKLVREAIAAAVVREALA